MGRATPLMSVSGRGLQWRLVGGVVTQLFRNCCNSFLALLCVESLLKSFIELVLLHTVTIPEKQRQDA